MEVAKHWLYLWFSVSYLHQKTTILTSIKSFSIYAIIYKFTMHKKWFFSFQKQQTSKYRSTGRYKNRYSFLYILTKFHTKIVKNIKDTAKSLA